MLWIIDSDTAPMDSQGICRFQCLGLVHTRLVANVGSGTEAIGD